MADNSERIAEIRSILQEGVKTVTTDGTTVVYDLVALRKELKELVEKDSASRRRRVFSINLSRS